MAGAPVISPLDIPLAPHFFALNWRGSHPASGFRRDLRKTRWRGSWRTRENEESLVAQWKLGQAEVGDGVASTTWALETVSTQAIGVLMGHGPG